MFDGLAQKIHNELMHILSLPSFFPAWEHFCHREPVQDFKPVRVGFLFALSQKRIH